MSVNNVRFALSTDEKCLIPEPPTNPSSEAEILQHECPVIVIIHERVQTEHLELLGLIPIPILPALRSANCPKVGAQRSHRS